MKIILGVDGSKYSTWATDWALALPLSHPRQVSAIHVEDLAALSAPFMVQPAMVGYQGFIQAEAKRLDILGKRVVQQTRKRLWALKAKGTVSLQKGPVAATILKNASGCRALAVVGQRGLTNFDRFFLGSVSAQVALHAPCSVLIVKTPARQLKRILLAVDGSKSSSRAVDFLLKQIDPVKPGRIEVVVFQVVPPFAYAQVTMAGLAATQQSAQKLERAGYIVKESIQAGDPAEQILGASKTYKADLLVMGAKGRTAIGRFLLGSVSSKVLRHSPCSILVVR
jgi:nucleotide-binding universal stress UspA family protein